MFRAIGLIIINTIRLDNRKLEREQTIDQGKLDEEP